MRRSSAGSATLRRRIDLAVQPVRPACPCSAGVPADRCVADHHGLHDVRADEDEPGAAVDPGPGQTMFTWTLPVIFTVLLASLPAGLVIY